VAVMEPGDLAGWRHHSRLAEGLTLSQWARDHLDFLISIFVEWLPGSLLLGPVIVALWRGEAFRDDGLLQALVLYAGVATLVLLVWPGGIATRYAMPASPALAVMSGILFERWWSSRPWLVGAGNSVVIAIAGYLVLLGWVAMPLLPDLFRQTRIAAQQIEAVRALRPGPLYGIRGSSNVNILAIVAAPVRLVTLSDIARLPVPALALLTPAEIDALAGSGLRVVPHAVPRDKSGARVVEVFSAN